MYLCVSYRWGNVTWSRFWFQVLIDVQLILCLFASLFKFYMRHEASAKLNCDMQHTTSFYAVDFFFFAFLVSFCYSRTTPFSLVLISRERHSSTVYVTHRAKPKHCSAKLYLQCKWNDFCPFSTVSQSLLGHEKDDFFSSFFFFFEKFNVMLSYR